VTIPIIDAHVHVGRWREPGFTPVIETPEETVRLYRTLQYRGVLAMPTDQGHNEELLQFVRAQQGPVQVRFACWISPDDPGSLGWVNRALDHVAAFKLHPSFLKRPITDPSFIPYLQLASDHGRPAVIHCGRWQEIAGFHHALEVARRYPELNLILSHMGGDSPLLVKELLDILVKEELPNVYLGTESIREYWLVLEAIQRLGPNRLVFGSDFNLNHPEVFRALIDHCGLSNVDRYLVFFGNINRLLPEGLQFQREDIPRMEANNLPARLESEREALKSDIHDWLLDSVEQGVVLWDHQRRVIYWNRAMERATAVARAEVLDKSAYELFPFLEEKGVDKQVDRAFEGQRVESGTIRFHIPKTDRVGFRRSVFVPLIDDRHGVQAVAEVVTFLTEGTELLVPGPMERNVQSMAVLANGLATRLSNHLGVVRGYCQLLREELTPNQDTDGTIDIIDDATKKAFDINRQLFSFARQQGVSLEYLRVEDVLRYTVDSFRLGIGGGVQITLNVARHLPTIRGNEVQLREAFYQVLHNAQESLDSVSQKRIDISVDDVRLEEETENGALVAPAGAFVRVSFRDYGVGISDEIHERVMQPFFTTRGSERLGLGMSLIQNTVRNHNGFHRIHSLPGQGTTVDLYFPHKAPG
jgi:signal transduction histidine kinase/predicted TIM-barrel fold metal-dependent hydrolase